MLVIFFSVDPTIRYVTWSLDMSSFWQVGEPLSLSNFRAVWAIVDFLSLVFLWGTVFWKKKTSIILLAGIVEQITFHCDWGQQFMLPCRTPSCSPRNVCGILFVWGDVLIFFSAAKNRFEKCLVPCWTIFLYTIALGLWIWRCSISLFWAPFLFSASHVTFGWS